MAAPYEDIWSYLIPGVGGPMPDTLADKYAGILSKNQVYTGGGDDPGSNTSYMPGYTADWSKLPKPIASGMTTANQPLLNPKMVYNDPNYGPLTPFTNIKQGSKYGNIAPQLWGGIGMSFLGGLMAAGLAAEYGAAGGLGGRAAFSGLGQLNSRMGNTGGLSPSTGGGIGEMVMGATRGTSTASPRSNLSPIMALLQGQNQAPQQTHNRNIQNLQLLQLLQNMR